MRVQSLAAIVVLLVACNRGGDDATPQAPPALDPSQLQNANGEVSLSDGGEMSYDITSERYKQWYAAQQSLDHATAARFGTILHPNSPSAASIDQATSFLERNPRTRAGIEHSGMSVRDFVQMTVALQQQFRDAAQAGGATQDLPYYVPPPLDTAMPPPPVSTVPAPMPEYVPPPVYTPTPSTTPTYTQPQPYTPVQPVTPVDTAARIRRDSIFDSLRVSPKPAPRPPVVTPTPVPKPVPPPATDTTQKSDTTSTTTRDSLPRP